MLASYRSLTLLLVLQSLFLRPAVAAPADESLAGGIPNVGAILSTDRINPNNPPFLVECTCKCVTSEQLSPGRFTFCDRGGLATDGKSCDQAFAGQKDFCWKLGIPPKKVACVIAPGSCTSTVVPIAFPDTVAE